jgi:hypothetical protein
MERADRRTGGEGDRRISVPPRTLWRRAARLLPMINWELHVLQAGLDGFASARPWVGVPLVGVALLVIWAAYWLTLPLVLAICLVTRLLHPIESHFRSPS